MPTYDLDLNRKVVRDYIENVINTGNTENISRYISQDYIEDYNGERYLVGIEGAIDHVKSVRKTYPDLKLIIEKQICEEDWVVTSYAMSGTHAGEWLGIPPTHEKITIHGVNLDRVVDGKIVEHGGAANLLEPLLGVKVIRIVENSD